MIHGWLGWRNISTSADDLDSLGAGNPDGSWDITLRHPAGNQQLVLTLKKDGVKLDGTVTNTALGLTIPLTDGHTDRNTFSGTSMITTPIKLAQNWTGTIHGTRVTGHCEVSGMGTYPFDGTRTPVAAA